MSQRLRVTLTATSNTYLQQYLPATGTMEIGEINLLGGIVWATFAMDGRNPRTDLPYAIVEVKDVEFTYAKPDYATLSAARLLNRTET